MYSVWEVVFRFKFFFVFFAMIFRYTYTKHKPLIYILCSVLRSRWITLFLKNEKNNSPHQETTQKWVESSSSSLPQLVACPVQEARWTLTPGCWWWMTWQWKTRGQDAENGQSTYAGAHCRHCPTHLEGEKFSLVSGRKIHGFIEDDCYFM